MKTSRIFVCLLALIMVLSCTLAACSGNNTTTGGTPGGPTNPSTNSGNAGDLVITVEPKEVEMYAGDDVVLLFGVSVNNDKASLIVSDDGGFDSETPGEYTITYTAELDGKRATATRKITVLEPLSDVALEVQIDNLVGLNKWDGKVISFKNSLYMELTEDTTLGKNEDETYISGIFRNTSDKNVVLSIAGSHGSAAIIDKNGIVIEGRDGANSKFVNAENPDRAGSKVTSLVIDGATATVSEAFAKNLVIPAGGFAVVVQTGYAGDGFDHDGRGFIAQNVINKYGNMMRIYWVDSGKELTEYVDQAPTVSSNTEILVAMGDKSFDLDSKVLAGLVISDDNGTFIADDDVPYTTEEGCTIKLEIIDKVNFNVDVAGKYSIRLKVTDGNGNAREFTRVVNVSDEGISAIVIGDNKLYVSEDKIAIDKDLSAVGKYAFVVYTSNYNGTINYQNGWGVAIVCNEYGEIIRIYDGTTGKMFDSEHPFPDGSKPDGLSANYLTMAFDSLQDGETLIVAPNAPDNNPQGGSRYFLVNNRTLGATVSLTGVNFDSRSKIITIGDKTYAAAEGKWLFNTQVAAADAAKYSLLIYDKTFDGTVSINGWGAALVLDRYGVLVRIYDGANGALYTVDGKSSETPTFNSNNYATVAFEELQDGETLIICVNDGGVNESRAFALSLRGVNGGKCYCGTAATVSGMTFEEIITNDMTIAAGGKKYTAEEGKWLYNTAVETTTAQNYAMVIYDKNYEGTFTTNGWGVAIVVDKYGTLVKIYAWDGFWTVDGKAEGELTFDMNTYAVVAFAELQEGETLIIFPNGGTAGNEARGWAKDLTEKMGTSVKLKGFTFEEKDA